MTGFSRNGKNGNGQNGPIAPAPSKWLRLVILALVMSILAAVAGSLTEVVRGLEKDYVWILMAVGMAFGYVLTLKARWKWSALLLTFSFGGLFSAMQVGRLWDELFKVFSEIVFWLRQAYPELHAAFWNGDTLALPSIGTFVSAFVEYMADMYLVLERLVLWIVRFPSLNSDFTAILMVWSMAIWLSVVWVVWMLWRADRPLEGVIPAFLMVGVALSYADESTNNLLFMLGATIGLMVLVAQLRREREWIEKQVGYSSVIRKTSTQAAIMLSAFLVISAAGITSIDVDAMKERWEDFMRDRNRTSASSNVPQNLGITPNPDPERQTLAEKFGKISRGGMPTDHLIGSGPELAEQVVMVVRVEEKDPQTGRTLDVDPLQQRYYFRSLTFDRYTPQGWVSNSSKIYVYQPEQEAIDTYTNRQRLIVQDVQFEDTNTQLIYVVGELAVVDKQYNVAWREGTGLSSFLDMFAATYDDRSYEAYSVVPVYSAEDLRATGQDYPEWISRYLVVPDTVPGRVRDLAFELTYKEVTAYDKAVAIEQYLRTFPYTLDLPDRPGGVDVADYFLFDLKRGYCDYYATTMVILARSIGLPARLAVGYAGGTYDPENDNYVVTADLAHSWVEIYFPDYGWVTFEPTGGVGEIARQETLPEVDNLQEFEREINFEAERTKLTIWQLVQVTILGIFGTAALVLAVWLQVDIFILRRQDLRRAFARLYKSLLWFGHWLDVPRANTQTPLEFSAEMTRRLKEIQSHTKLLRRLDVTAGYVEDIVRHANRTAYSNEPPDVIDRGQTVRTWRSLRWRLFFAVVWYRFDKWRPKWRKPQAFDSI